MAVDQAELNRQAAARLGQLVDDKYRLLSVLGVGGMGAVYVAHHRFTDRRVALKVLHAGRSSGVNAQRFLREAKAATHIDHPRVAAVFDAGEDPESGLYLAMELLEGEDLGRAIREDRAPPRTLVQMAGQVLDALEAAHDKGFVHRDIKPANIFLVRGEDGVDARLLDFGVARQLAPGAGRLTQAGAVLGTPYFMSPEQMCGEGVDGRADLWALGVVLFYGLTGALPFRAEGYVELLKQMLQAGPPSPRTLRPELDAGLSEVVERALSPGLDARFSHAGQMRTALRATAPARYPSVRAPITPPAAAPEPVAPPPRAAPVEARPPAWADALAAIEAETDAMQTPDEAPEPPKRGWFRRLKGD